MINIPLLGDFFVVVLALRFIIKLRFPNDVPHFNKDVNEADIRSIVEDNRLVNLIHRICSKTANEKCIDLMVTNNKSDCFCSSTFETGFSDFHHT